MDARDFPTVRAYFLLANHDRRLGLMALSLVVAGIIGLMPLLVLWPYIPYWTEGVRVKGAVVGRDPVAFLQRQTFAAASILAHGGGRRGPSRFIDYEYNDPAGVLQRGRSQVDFDTWNRLQAGDAVDVVYLASDAAKSRLWLGLDNGLTAAMAFGSIGLIGIALGIRSAILAIMSIRREVQLLREGTLVDGEVIEVVRERYDKRSEKCTINYRYMASTSFASPPETFVNSYTSIGKPWFSGQVGDAVPVVHSPDVPERSSVDRFKLRTE